MRVKPNYKAAESDKNAVLKTAHLLECFVSDLPLNNIGKRSIVEIMVKIHQLHFNTRHMKYKTSYRVVVHSINNFILYFQTLLHHTYTHPSTPHTPLIVEATVCCLQGDQFGPSPNCHLQGSASHALLRGQRGTH